MVVLYRRSQGTNGHLKPEYITMDYILINCCILEDLTHSALMRAVGLGATRMRELLELSAIYIQSTSQNVHYQRVAAPPNRAFGFSPCATCTLSCVEDGAQSPWVQYRVSCRVGVGGTMRSQLYSTRAVLMAYLPVLFGPPKGSLVRAIPSNESPPVSKLASRCDLSQYPPQRIFGPLWLMVRAMDLGPLQRVGIRKP